MTSVEKEKYPIITHYCFFTLLFFTFHCLLCISFTLVWLFFMGLTGGWEGKIKVL